MRSNRRYQVVLGLALAASCAAAAVSVTGRTRRAWALLAASAAAWAVGQATWVWYEHLAQRELPFPSLADVGYLTAIPLAAAAMLAFPGRAERAVLQARSLLDGAVIATSLLYSSWALVLGPALRAGHTSVLEQAIALTYPLGDVILVTVVFVVVARIRVGGAPSCCSRPACSAWPWPTPASPTSPRRAPTGPGSPPTSAGSWATCWWRWPPAGPRPSGSPGSGGGRAGSRSCRPTAPGPGRRHLGHPAAARPGQRALPVLDLRRPGAADRRPPAAHRA